ncbi:cytochrome P450 [Dinghuibacter silviterrae]|uniref:Cytochrome P450 n=1 Tax=Dinghuibacter silviterrae TaxID=1539049 RepID=A0A4R8DGT9_9BACT|nr:cytochrome P450 [Dinghuibacter silviterrae]TDW96899.1 cytochrome P450 [Dinghuibacter silviterrae]
MQSPHQLGDLSSWYAQMRNENPVYYDEEFPLIFGPKGSWQVFCYEDVRRVLSDYSVFSNEYMPKIEENPIGNSFNQTDPPLHGKLRALVSGAFSVEAMRQLEDTVYTQCEGLITKVLNQGEWDIVNDFALPLSASVIAQALGIPPQHFESFNAWTKMVVEGTGFYQGQEGMKNFFLELFEERRMRPQPDLISHLLTENMDPEHIFAHCIILFMAGYETTSTLIGNALFYLSEHETLQDQLHALPGDIPRAINEVLRLRPSALNMYRIAAQDVELKGQWIKKGQFVTAWIGSANRDPSVFPYPNHFDLDRTNFSQILSFGHGIHFCVGAPLARLEARIALEVILRHMKKLKVRENTQLVPATSSTMLSGFKSLPLTFEVRA